MLNSPWPEVSFLTQHVDLESFASPYGGWPAVEVLVGCGGWTQAQWGAEPIPPFLEAKRWRLRTRPQLFKRFIALESQPDSKLVKFARDHGMLFPQRKDNHPPGHMEPVAEWRWHVSRVRFIRDLAAVIRGSELPSRQAKEILGLVYDRPRECPHQSYFAKAGPQGIESFSGWYDYGLTKPHFADEPKDPARIPEFCVESGVGKREDLFPRDATAAQLIAAATDVISYLLEPVLTSCCRVYFDLGSRRIPYMPSNPLGAIYWTMLAHLDATPGEVRFCQCGCGEEIRVRSKKKIWASDRCRVNGNRWKKEGRLPAQPPS
ncbi:MAG: hypothetical protein K1X67_00300 [Fimbriimonadaceae bacterium]|nr:hypothetical protein [Fimbriimonadaceae bacterium]